jgi:chemotaxis protein CheD
MPSPTLTGFDHRLVVGLGEMVVSNSQNVVLATYSLGSCLGITIYDPVAKVGGLLHAMLPDSTIDSAKAAAKPGMFVDTGVPALFRSAYQLRAEKHRIQICVAGGAQILDNNGYFNIGKRNYDALCEILQRNGLRIAAQQVGGLVNRTVYLKVQTGGINLKVSGQPSEIPLWNP